MISIVWPEAFAVPNKKAETVAHLLVEEIFPRFGGPLQLVTDNGPENANKILAKTLKELKIHHVFTSYYHPQGNGKVERLHRIMNDMLAKNVNDNDKSWDLYLNQILAAIRFNVSETTKFSPFFLLYNRDVILPLDNILKPRRRYYGNDHHEVAAQEQHRAFTLVKNNVEGARKRQLDRINKKTEDIEFQPGDLVFYKNHCRIGKLDKRWKPGYVVVEKTGPVSYKINDQLTSSVVKAHASQLREARMDNWVVPETGWSGRKVTLATPVDTQLSDSDSDTGDILKRYRRQRENSDDESDIPLAELQIRLRQMQDSETVTPEDLGSDRSDIVSDDSQTDTCSPCEMDVSAVTKKNISSRVGYIADSERVREAKIMKAKVYNKSHKRGGDRKEKLKSLVDLIGDLL